MYFYWSGFVGDVSLRGIIEVVSTEKQEDAQDFRLYLEGIEASYMVNSGIAFLPGIVNLDVLSLGF